MTRRTYRFKAVNILYIFGMVISFSLQIAFSYGIAYFLNYIVTPKNSTALLPWMLYMLTLVVISSVASVVGGQYFPLRVQLKKSIEISQDVMRSILGMPLKEYYKKESGQYINLVTSSAFTYGDIYGQYYIDLVSNILYALMVIMVALTINWRFSVVFVLYIPLCWLISHGPSKTTAQYQEKGLPTQDAFLSETKRIIGAKREINIAGANDFFVKKYVEKSNNHLSFIKKFRFYNILCTNLPGILSNVFLIAVLSLAAYLAFSGELNIGEIFFVYQLLTYYSGPVTRVFEILIHKRVNEPHIDRVEEVLAQEKLPSGFERFRNLKGNTEVEVNNFSFFTSSQKDQHLFKIGKLSIPKNSLVVIKGKNGSGKSMLMNFLSGYGDPEGFEGTVQLSADWSDVAYLTYPLVVVNGDLHENMFGKKADENIQSLLDVDFSDKVFTDNPVNLSYGQQQKLNLLRVLSTDKKILILDEPLTNLDRGTQARFLNYIRAIKGTKTIFVIMHGPELDDIADIVLSIRPDKLVAVNREEKSDL